MLPADLPTVALWGIPARLPRAAGGAGQGGYWEWIGVTLDGVGPVAVFDPDHACPPGFFGRPCRLAVELFQPEVAPNPARRAAIEPQRPAADPDAPPVVAGRVAGLHRHAWRYTGPVTSAEGGRRVVRHVLNAPQVTVRLVLDVGCGTLLAQLRDPALAPGVGEWVTLRGGRAELIAIELAA